MDTTGVRAGHARSSFFWLAAGAFVFACASAPGNALADEQSVEANPAPIVRVNIREGDVTIRTWNRPTITIDGDPSLSVEKRTVQTAATAPIAIPQMQQDSARGTAVLPPESFVAAAIPPGAHDVIVVKSALATPRAPVVVTVPNDTVFVYARAASGKLDVNDYRGGTLVAVTRNGRLSLNDVGGTVFAQTLRGPLVSHQSSFDRVRARSLFGNVSFERCDARQIEATTIDGSIVYDGGTFAPGLARFESTNGNVAIGASGNVQYGAHAIGAGRVYTSFTGRVQIDQRGPDTNAVVGEGGPLVTATTQGGNVYLYDGSLRTRTLPPEWQPAIQTLDRPGTRPYFPLRGDAAPQPPPRVAPQGFAPQRFAPQRFAAPRTIQPRFAQPRFGQRYAVPRRIAPRRFTPPPAYRRFERH